MLMTQASCGWGRQGLVGGMMIGKTGASLMCTVCGGWAQRNSIEVCLAARTTQGLLVVFSGIGGSISLDILDMAFLFVGRHCRFGDRVDRFSPIPRPLWAFGGFCVPSLVPFFMKKTLSQQIMRRTFARPLFLSLPDEETLLC